MPIRWSGSSESSAQQQQQPSSSSSSSSNQNPSIYTNTTTNYGMDQHAKPALRPLQPQPFMQSQPQHHDYANSSSIPTPNYPYPAYYRGPPIPPPLPQQQQHHLQPHSSQQQQQQQQRPPQPKVPPNTMPPEWRDDRHDAKRIRISRAW